MARAALVKTEQVALTSNGLNLTDAALTTLSTGSGNGVSFAYDGNDLVVLRNDTGGDAVYTLVLRSLTGVTSVGGSLTNPTVTVATAKDHVFKLPDIFKQADGNAYIDCDVAAKVGVINL